MGNNHYITVLAFTFGYIHWVLYAYRCGLGLMMMMMKTITQATATTVKTQIKMITHYILPL